MPAVETGDMSAVETRQMTATETSVLSQQDSYVLSQHNRSVNWSERSAGDPSVGPPNRGGFYLTASTAPTVEEGGPPISPDLAIGGPIWSRRRLQTTF